MTPEIKTPTSIVVLAGCPSCGLTQPLRVYLNAELVISDEGSVLALKAKASKSEHICGQAGLFDESPEPRTPQEIADEVITFTPEVQEVIRSAVKHLAGGRTVDPETGEILVDEPELVRDLVEDNESLDAAIARLEKRADYAELIGTAAGQALLEAVKNHGGGWIPFMVAPLRRTGARA